VEIDLSIEPALYTGFALLMPSWNPGNCPVKVWLAETKGVEVTLPKVWDLSKEALPAKLYVEGYHSGDVGLELSYNERASQPDTVTFHVVDIEYPGPFSQFTFTSGNPGILSFDCVASYSDELDMDQYVWTIDDIGEVQRTWDPSTAHGEAGSGRISTVTFTDLPANNSSFGKKRITLSYNYDGISFTIYRDIKVFFPRDATNHPGGTTPNWFYYWIQTSANYGSPQYDPNIPWSKIDWRNNQWIAIVVAPVPGSYTPPPGGDNTGNQLDGIDTFAWTCRHEGRHVETSTQWYPFGYNSSIDGDSDWMPNLLEPILGGTQENPINGGPFIPGVKDSDGDGMRDDEDYTVATQANWTEGSADTKDWSDPGHQSNN
jgi:hypothetical protein